MLAVCLLLAGCGHAKAVLPSVAETSSQPHALVVWHEHAYKSGGFHYVPVRTFLLGRAVVSPTALTPAVLEPPVVQRQPVLRAIPREIIVHFALNSASLSEEARQDLGNSLKRLKAAQQVTVVGYTCSLGSQERNDQLARARAEAVEAFLEENGVPVARLASRGKCCYVAPNDTEEGRAQNRRVVVSYSATD